MKLRKILCPLLAVTLLILGTARAFAMDTVDTDRLGSIHLTLRYEGNPVTGGDLVLYRVADVQVENGYSFALRPELAGSGVALDDLSAADLAEALESAVNEAGLEGTRSLFDEQGEIRFDKLPVGLYLLVQENAAPGYEKLSPAVVSVPMSEDGTYLYDVDATPKLALSRTPVLLPHQPPEEPHLPQTGQLNWPVPVLAAAGLVCLIAGVWLLRSGKKEARG